MTPRLDQLFARLRAVFRKPALDAELDDELAHHLEMLVEENLAAGLSPTEARRRARLALGGVEQTRELHRETRGLPRLMHSMLVGVSPFDPGTYLAISATVLLCAFTAGYLPARRASRVDPMQALRTE